MQNLLKETRQLMSHHGVGPEDVTFIGSLASGHSCSWEQFTRLADVSYDDGFGAAEVATDLVILFRDGSWLTRGEYDGSEWWNFHRTPQVPTETRPVAMLVGDYWPTLADLTDPSDTHHRRKGVPSLTDA